MDNRPIGIFDSGFGGLTAVSALRKLLPNENIIYFGDSARVPYGAKAVSQLRVMARQDMDFAASKGAKVILAACGTVSSTAGDVLDAYEIPVFGVLRTSVAAMSEIKGNAPLAVIATDASIKSGAFQREIEKHCPQREIISVPCHDFVPLIESGHAGAGDPLVRSAVEKYMRPIKEAGAAAVLLACTHYGIIGEAISAYLGKDVQLVSASECAASAVRKYLTENGLCGGSGEERYYTSGSAEAFTEAAGIFLGRALASAAEHVEPEEVPEP